MTGSSPRATARNNGYNELAWFVGEPTIGEGTWVGPFCMIDGSGGLTIGHGCDIAAGTHIYTHSSAARCASAGASPIDRAPVVIGDHTFLGANSVVLMGVTIGSHCIVGAGSVVTQDLPDASIAVGSPAQIIGRVDPTTGRRVAEAT